MTKIAFIGAGSFGFTRKLVRDLVTFPLLEGATIALMDIDAERLGYIKNAVDRIVQEGGRSATVMTTLDRAEALRDADAVICTILSGGVQVWRHDLEIPKKYGVDINIGDTRGPAGIFRALRTIPVMLDICHNMERYCPDAILLNYTNPMAMLCRAMQRETRVLVTGLCHSVQGTAAMLARWIGAPLEEVEYVSAGINHQSFYIKYEWNGEDAYPLIREAVSRPEIYREELVRNEMLLHLGYYVTESSGHNSEYNWWFRKRADLIERYCSDGTGWNPGKYAYSVNRHLERADTWKQSIGEWLSESQPLDLQRGNEYAAHIVNAYLGGDPYKFNGNVPNRGLISNVPKGVCVEVPVYADKSGLNAIHVGALPPQCAALVNVSVASEEMAVEGCLAGDPTLVYHAIAYDPLTASVLSLAEIKRMVNEMFAKNRDYLPTFKHFVA